jgi:hypothetical protein
VPEFSFITVDSKDVFDAFMAVKSDASGLDGIPLLFVKMLLPVVSLRVSMAGFSDFRPISLLPCLSKVCEVLMTGQMNRHIRNFGLLCPFQ